MRNVIIAVIILLQGTIEASSCTFNDVANFLSSSMFRRESRLTSSFENTGYDKRINTLRIRPTETTPHDTKPTKISSNSIENNSLLRHQDGKRSNNRQLFRLGGDRADGDVLDESYYDVGSFGVGSGQTTGNNELDDESNGSVDDNKSWWSFGSSSSSNSKGSPSNDSSSYGSSYGTSTSYSNNNPSSYGSNSYSSYGSDSYGGSHSYSSSSYKYKSKREPVKVPLSWALTISLSILSVALLVTSHQLIRSPKGSYADFCQSIIARLECVWRLCYNLYHCRLGDIHDEVVCALDDEEEYTELELQTMKLRPGIEKALTVEHNRALKKMNGKQTRKKIKDKILNKIGPIRMGPGMIALENERRERRSRN